MWIDFKGSISFLSYKCSSNKKIYEETYIKNCEIGNVINTILAIVFLTQL